MIVCTVLVAVLLLLLLLLLLPPPLLPVLNSSTCPLIIGDRSTPSKPTAIFTLAGHAARHTPRNPCSRRWCRTRTLARSLCWLCLPVAGWIAHFSHVAWLICGESHRSFLARAWFHPCRRLWRPKTNSNIPKHNKTTTYGMAPKGTRERRRERRADSIIIIISSSSSSIHY